MLTAPSHADIKQTSDYHKALEDLAGYLASIQQNPDNHPTSTSCRNRKLVDQLMLRCSGRDILVLRGIRWRLQQQKQANQFWGNVSKTDDRMFKFLAESVKLADVHDHDYKDATNRFVKNHSM